MADRILLVLNYVIRKKKRAIEQNVPLVLFIMLFKVILNFKRV